MRLALALVAALWLFPATSEARDCRSGKTVYAQDGVRIFEDGRGYADEWFACGPSSARPTSLWSDSSVEGAIRVFARHGDQVLLTGDFYGEGGGEDTAVGWFDARTSQARLGQLATTLNNAVLEIAVGPDGGVGVVSGYEATGGASRLRVGYLAPRGDELGRELALSTATGYVQGSLTFGAGTLGWALASGEQRSVPLGGEPVTCTSGTTLLENDGARVFEVLPNRATDRGFQADVLAACARGASTPRELAVSELSTQDHWSLRAERRAGTRVAFLAGQNGIGVLEGGAVRFVATPLLVVHDIAIGETGPLVFAGDGVIAREAAVFGWERIADAYGTVAKDSLTLAGDQVTWRTDRPRSARLRPETPPTCASGKTRLRTRGLRVFEVLRTGGDAALLACAPGASVPLPLLTPFDHPRWSVSELAREHGRLALLVHAKGAETHDVISFDAQTVRVGQLYTDAGKVRDAALAADGRVAVAIQRGRKWRISALSLGAPGQLGEDTTVAEPRAGVRPGSLAFHGDRVVWRAGRGN